MKLKETISWLMVLCNGYNLIVERTTILEVTTIGRVVWQLGANGDRWNCFMNCAALAPHDFVSSFLGIFLPRNEL